MSTQLLLVTVSFEGFAFSSPSSFSTNSRVGFLSSLVGSGPGDQQMVPVMINRSDISWKIIRTAVSKTWLPSVLQRNISKMLL